MQYRIAVAKCRTKWEISDLNGTRWEVDRIGDLHDGMHVKFTDNGGNGKGKMFYVQLEAKTLRVENNTAVFTP